MAFIVITAIAVLIKFPQLVVVFLPYLPVVIAAIGLSFSGYGSWTIGRDRKVEALGNVRGCVYRFLVATNFFEKLNDDPDKQYEAYKHIEKVKGTCLEIDHAMEVALSKTAGFITERAYDSVREFVTSLRELNSMDTTPRSSPTNIPSIEDWQSPMNEFKLKWVKLKDQANALSDEIGRAIRQHKFRRLFM